MKQSFKKITLPLLVAVFGLITTAWPYQVVYATFPGQNGRLLWDFAIFSEENPQVLLKDINLDGTGQRTLMPLHFSGDVMAPSPSYTADGQRIVYVTAEAENNSNNLFIANADGTNIQKLTTIQEEDVTAALWPSISPDSTSILYTEANWSNIVSSYRLMKIQSDGTNQQVFDVDGADDCDAMPRYSPDGTKIAFFRYSPLDETRSIYTANVDGSNVQEMTTVEMGGNASDCSTAFTAMMSLDWSPDSTKLVYTEQGVHDIENDVSSVLIKTVTVATQVTDVVVEGAYHGTGGSSGDVWAGSAQYTPEGQIVYKQIAIDAAAGQTIEGSLALYIVQADGTNSTIIPGTTFEIQNMVDHYSALFGYLSPTIQPLPNAATLQNPETGASISLTTPIGTQLTCSTTLKESAATTQDASYSYPLGLVDFCFDTETTNNQVTLTFITDLTPAQVTARKYNPITASYTDVPGATITETTLNNQHALQLTYTIVDNGPLDLDPLTGQIKDPVGLAVVAGQSGGGLAATGESVAYGLMLALTAIGLGMVILRRYFV